MKTQQALPHPPIISETVLSTENNCYCLLRQHVTLRRMLTFPRVLLLDQTGAVRLANRRKNHI